MSVPIFLTKNAVATGLSQLLQLAILKRGLGKKNIVAHFLYANAIISPRQGTYRDDSF
jgi:hypothetical protein